MKTARTRARAQPASRRTGRRTRQAVVPTVASDAGKTVLQDSDGTERDGNQLRDQLRALLVNEDLPAAARVNAARTLAELEGLIGRHQAAPDRTAIAGLSSLTREDLIGELDRLRTLFGLGLVR